MMQAFKKPIHREDLVPVLLSGIFIALVSGLLVGAIKLMMEETFSLYLQLIFSVVLAFYISRRIKNTYQTYHVVYSVITVIAFVFAFYIMNVTYYVGYLYIRNVDIFNGSVIRFLLDPRHTFYIFNIFSPSFLSVTNILEVLFFLIGAIYAFNRSK